MNGFTCFNKNHLPSWPGFVQVRSHEWRDQGSVHFLRCCFVFVDFLPQVTMMVAAAGLSCTASLFVSAYSCLTFTYGEEDQDIFHHHSSLKVVTILSTISIFFFSHSPQLQLRLQKSMIEWLIIESWLSVFIRSWEGRWWWMLRKNCERRR